MVGNPFGLPPPAATSFHPMKRRFFPVVALWALAAVGAAQTLDMGAWPPGYEFDRTPLEPEAVQTFVDLYSPATATGSIVTASFMWSAVPCPAAAKLKVFRRRGETLVFVAERGPFEPVSNNDQNVTSVTLDPPVDVQHGDLLGLSRVAKCGGPLIAPRLSPGGPHLPLPTEGLARFDGDLTRDVPFSSGRIEARDRVLMVYASGPATELVASVLPVAGSTPGAFDSYFRTAIQLSNPSSLQISGRLEFHPSGAVSSSADPGLPFSVEPFSTFAEEDIVEAMGQSGLGTLDVVVPIVSVGPLVSARVYADAGDRGTFGFTEEGVAASCCGSQVISIGGAGLLVAPPDPVHFRFNIGVRALFKAPTITFRVLGADGTALWQATRSYPPSTFVQEPAETLLGGPLAAGALITVEVSAGTAIVYGATVDNRTNDPSIQFAK